ncbi:MAG: hypothetical protein KF847_05055 [Pirellulales bacterium]|nr:hypothetical protein [Pirellulales bacterium]
MNAGIVSKRKVGGQMGITPFTWLAVGLVASGLALGVTVHRGWMILAALGAFGPGVLRELGVLRDFDELQKTAAAKAGLRAYLATGVALFVVVIGQTWNRLDLGTDLVPASLVLTVALVVYYASYCLSFWDPKVAVSRVLWAFGLLWLAFVLMSHGNEPVAALAEGLIVPGPFILGALLCKRWPRAVGAGLLVACAAIICFFGMYQLGDAESRNHAGRMYTITLIPLPLAIAGVALVTAEPDDEESK